MGRAHDLSARLAKKREYPRNIVLSAREFIYKLGKPISGAAVERLLKEQSLVPTVVWSCV
jgi:hypothetical protein